MAGKRRVVITALILFSTLAVGAAISAPNPPIQDAEGLAASIQTRQTPAVKSVQTPPTDDGTARIRLLGVNDFHGNLTSPKEIDGRAVGGAAHLAAYLDALEEESGRETLRVHSGDMVGASPLASAHYRDEPAVRAMNGMDFDVGVLGNHEFDAGMDEMTRLLEGTESGFPGADFPYLAANVIRKSDGDSILPAYQVKEADGVRVGFIGVVTPETPAITDPSIGESLGFSDISDTVNRYAGELEERGVSTIVVLAHSGGVQDESGASGEIVSETRQMSDSVDAVFGGHTHARMQTNIGGKVLLEGGSYGEAVSVLDLDVDRKTGDIAGVDSRLVTTYNDVIPPEREMLDMTERYVRGVSEMSERELGVAASDVTRSSTSSGENALGDLIADARRDYTGSDFAFVLTGAMRDDLSAGTVTYGDVFAANPGQNDLMVTELSGEQVRRVLEDQFRGVRERRLQVSGLSYTYDRDLPEGSRITSVTLPDGSPVLADETYTVAAEEYIARGGNGFGVFAEGSNQRRVGQELDATIGYIENLPRPFSPPDPEAEQRIREV